MKRIQAIIECILNGEYIKGIGKGLVAGLNYLDDSSDTKLLAKKDWSVIREEFANYGKSMFNIEKFIQQNKFTFLKSTPIGMFAEKHKWLKDFIDKIDKTLIDSKWVQSIIKKCDKTAEIIIDDTATRPIKPLFSNKKFIINCGQVQVKGRFLTKLLVGSLTRITRLNILAALGLEVPAIILSCRNNDGKNGMARSLTSVTGVIAGGAILGALCIPIPGLPLIGLGLGTWLGGLAAKKINDKFFSKKETNKN